MFIELEPGGAFIDPEYVVSVIPHAKGVVLEIIMSTGDRHMVTARPAVHGDDGVSTVEIERKIKEHKCAPS